MTHESEKKFLPQDIGGMDFDYFIYGKWYKFRVHIDTIETKNESTCIPLHQDKITEHNVHNYTIINGRKLGIITSVRMVLYDDEE